jgi:hypothetical protein
MPACSRRAWCSVPAGLKLVPAVLLVPLLLARRPGAGVGMLVAVVMGLAYAALPARLSAAPRA